MINQLSINFKSITIFFYGLEYIKEEKPAPIRADKEKLMEIKADKPKQDPKKELKKEPLRDPAHKPSEVLKEEKAAAPKPRRDPKPETNVNTPKAESPVQVLKTPPAVKKKAAEATSKPVNKEAPLEPSKAENSFKITHQSEEEKVSKPLPQPKKLENVTLHKNLSKDKIKVFNEDDDHEIDAHLEESRKKFVDPMDQHGSDSSNPTTPIKIVNKPIGTDGSLAISEQALKDAKSYISGLYDKKRPQVKAFNYGERESDDGINCLLINIEYYEEQKVQNNPISEYF